MRICSDKRVSHVVSGIAVLYYLLGMKNGVSGSLYDLYIVPSLIANGFLSAGMALKSCNFASNNLIDAHLRLKNLLELDNLSLQLAEFEINTNIDMLLDSKLNSKKYTFEYKDSESNIKKLKEYKYIDVPVLDGESELILQEHFVGSKEYELSLPPDSKEFQLKLCKNLL